MGLRIEFHIEFFIPLVIFNSEFLDIQVYTKAKVFYSDLLEIPKNPSKNAVKIQLTLRYTE